MKPRKAAVRAFVPVAVCLLLTTSACGDPDNDDSGSDGSDSQDNTVAQDPEPGSEVPEGSGGVPRPQEEDTGPLINLKWRDYEGVRVPGTKEQPAKVKADGASGWAHDPQGAVLAGAHLAVVLDARQDSAIWGAALDSVSPASAVPELRGDLRGAAENQPDPNDNDGLVSFAWGRPASVMGYDQVEYSPKEASMQIWARSDSGEVSFRTRPIQLGWRDGDWRVLLPLEDWSNSTPPSSVEGIATAPQVEVEKPNPKGDSKNGPKKQNPRQQRKDRR